MVELLTEGGAFLRELPLQGSGAGDELAGYVFDGVLPCREKFTRAARTRAEVLSSTSSCESLRESSGSK